MPKAPPKNAFFYFMLDFKQKQEKRGTVFFGGLKDVATAADPHWKKLSKAEKEPYEKKAKEMKENPNTSFSSTHSRASSQNYDRLTSNGIAVSEIEREENAEKRRIQMRKNEVKEILSKAAKSDTLIKQTYYAMTFNYFIMNEEGHYMPCEMGVVRFSVTEGITAKCHAFIDPGKLPSGFAFSAKAHADETHELPLPPKALGTNVASDVVKMLMDFVSAVRTVPHIDIMHIFVLETEEKMVKDILMQLCEKSDVSFDRFKLLPLTYFFEQIHNTVAKYYGTPVPNPFTEIVAGLCLDHDQFRYNARNGCDYHEKSGINYHCAVARSTRWAYEILALVMPLAGIKTQARGYHFPKDCTPSEFVKGNKLEVVSVTSGTTETESMISSRISKASSRTMVGRGGFTMGSRMNLRTEYDAYAKTTKMLDKEHVLVEEEEEWPPLNSSRKREIFTGSDMESLPPAVDSDVEDSVSEVSAPSTVVGHNGTFSVPTRGKGARSIRGGLGDLERSMGQLNLYSMREKQVMNRRELDSSFRDDLYNSLSRQSDSDD